MTRARSAATPLKWALVLVLAVNLRPGLGTSLQSTAQDAVMAATATKACWPGYHLDTDGECVYICKGCGKYADEESGTCKVATQEDCPAGTFPRVTTKKIHAKSIRAACIAVGRGFRAVEVADGCYEAERCDGPAAFQDEFAQMTCKKFECPDGMVPRYTSGLHEGNAETACSPGAKAGEIFDEALGGVRPCAGCGAYQDEDGATSCKTATVESCPNGTMPAVANGATSLEDACAPMPDGLFYDPAECAPNRCAANASQVPIRMTCSIAQETMDSCRNIVSSKVALDRLFGQVQNMMNIGILGGLRPICSKGSLASSSGVTVPGCECATDAPSPGSTTTSAPIGTSSGGLEGTDQTPAPSQAAVVTPGALLLGAVGFSFLAMQH